MLRKARKVLLWIVACAAVVLLVVLGLATMFMLSVGGGFRGREFTAVNAGQLFLLVAVCVGLGVIAFETIRAARRP